MTLKILEPGLNPLGQFAGYSTDYLTLKGGEVVSFAAVATEGQPGVTTSGVQSAAYDVFDGYVNEGGTFDRPAVTRLFNGTTTLSAKSRPLMLADEGILGYGTLFGLVVGGVVGQQVNGYTPTSITGQILGPQTATGSGKVTCWDKEGLYAVTVDNTDGYLQPTNTSLFVGCPLTFTNMGLLTPSTTDGTYTGSTNMLASAPTVARLVEFNTSGALVNTPNYLVAALNSPSGSVSSVIPRQLTQATIWFNAPVS